MEVFCKVILSFWMSVTRHVQSTENKFAYLYNISIKAWRMKLLADKHESLLQVDTKIF